MDILRETAKGVRLKFLPEGATEEEAKISGNSFHTVYLSLSYACFTS